MKPVDTQEVRAALAAATPGPWRLSGPASVWADRDAAGWDAFHVADCRDAVGNPGDSDAANADLIANAPTWLADLCDEVERLRAVGKAARAFVADTPDPDWPSIGADNLAELIAALDALDAGGEA